MKAIVTLQNQDGTFDTVGMNNRRPINNLKTVRGIVNVAGRFAGSRPHRIEIHPFTQNSYFIFMKNGERVFSL